ncbi:unnamed protein product [Microthlaspi erraticum]|uniref:DUF1985 domain-containing protein n=1 Tax=Microthlaspi erraticum TaxID=1685480 RepID=A0A6D2I319_9BRAS|nr:unnamed protein product [Microthlaspi erraticum]
MWSSNRRLRYFCPFAVANFVVVGLTESVSLVVSWRYNSSTMSENSRASKPTFPRRFYTKGGDPEQLKSIHYYSNNTKLFSTLKQLLTDDEWEEICDSRVGVFLRSRDLDFLAGSTCDAVVPAITILNCDYVENLETPEADDTTNVVDFWETLGVSVEAGASVHQLIEACQWVGEWPREDRIRLGYLAIYAGFIQARKSSQETRVKLARFVMDLDRFHDYPWGRVAFKNLITTVKGGQYPT